MNSDKLLAGFISGIMELYLLANQPPSGVRLLMRYIRNSSSRASPSGIYKELFLRFNGWAADCITLAIMVFHMRCIFCKEDSSQSQSVEHIIPESLGNVEHILPKGVVCDKCNNYFSREIEKPLLESFYFQYARSRNSIPTKKGKLPTSKGFHPESGALIELMRDENRWSVFGLTESDERKFIKSIIASSQGTFIVPSPTEPLEDDKYLVSRFLGKVAVEALARTALTVEGGLDEIIDKVELDELRNYVRRGSQSLLWPYHQRRIYPEYGYFVEDGQPFEVLHEYMLLYTQRSELYLVIAIFGIEYALNIGGPEIDGYYNWLRENKEKSPLYP